MSDYRAKILVVDDQRFNREVLERLLKEADETYDVYKCENGREALQMIENNSFDLVLLDVIMPEIDGFETCLRIKENKDRNLPVIIITALNDKKSILKGLDVGADDFLSRPVDESELLVRVRNLLKVKRLTDDLDMRYNELRQELELARNLQQGFLPQSMPGLSQIDIGVLYKPSTEVGGDFYDFLHIDENHFGVFIGDVVGHGVSSAMITAVLKDHIHKNRALWFSPYEMMTHLNRSMHDFFNNTRQDYFVTAFYAVFDLGNEKVYFCNAGHPAPLLIQEKQEKKLQTENGFPLGIFPESSFSEEEESFTINSRIFFFTDGFYDLEMIPKNQNPDEWLYSRFQLENHKKIQDIINTFEDELNENENIENLRDDLNLIIVGRTK